MRVIGIVSGKGGVGKTTFVANFGLALSNLGKKVVAVDCNITTPHLGLNFGIYYSPLTLNNFLKGETSLQEIIYLHPTGLEIIPSSLVLDDLMGVDLEKIKLLLSELGTRNYEFVLLDSAPGMGKEAMSILNNCSEIIYITIPYMYALADILRCSRMARRLGLNEIGIVLNMVKNSTDELKVSQIEEISGLPVIAKIPFDKDFQISSAMGNPLINYKPNCKASKEIKKLAASLAGLAYEEKSFWRKIFDLLKRKK
jgi:septum site-determining protein MinD